MNKLQRLIIMYRTPRQKWYCIWEWIFEYLFKKFPKIEYFDGMRVYCWVEKFVKY